MTYDPVRREELRIMGYQEAFKAQPVMVKKMAAPFTCVTKHGVVTADAGDYKAETPTGEEYPISAEDFERDYLVTPEDLPEQESLAPVELPQPAGILQRQDETTTTQHPIEGDSA